MKIAGFFAVIVSFAVSAVSAAEVGTTGAQTLRRLSAARPLGLGEAYTGVGGDVDALPFNPASLAKINSAMISTVYQSGFADQSIGSINYAHPIPFGALFVGGGYFTAGDIELNQSDGTRGSVRAQQDFVGLAGIALGIDSSLSFGVTGKYLKSELAEVAQANVVAMDAGVHWTTPLMGLGLGAAMQNMGPDIEYERQGDPLPLTYRAGFAYTLDFAKMGLFKQFPYVFMLTADGVKTKDEEAGVHSGFEIRRDIEMSETTSSAALRGGYRSESQAVDIGVGFMIARVALDYSVGLVSDLDPSHRFSLGYRFR